MSDVTASLIIGLMFTVLATVAGTEVALALWAGVGVCVLAFAYTLVVAAIRAEAEAREKHRAALKEQAAMIDAFNKAYFYYHYVIHG